MVIPCCSALLFVKAFALKHLTKKNTINWNIRNVESYSFAEHHEVYKNCFSNFPKFYKFLIFRDNKTQKLLLTNRKKAHLVTKFCSYKTYLRVKTTELYKNSWINVLHREFLVAKLQRWFQMLSIMFINKFSERIHSHSKHNVLKWNSFAISKKKDDGCLLSGGSRISQRRRHSQRWTSTYHLAKFSWKLNEIKEIFLCRSTSDWLHLTNTTKTYIILTWWADSKTSLVSLPVLSKLCFIYGQKCTYSASMLTFIIMDQTFVLLECTWVKLQGHLSSSLESGIFSTKFETKSI